MPERQKPRLRNRGFNKRTAIGLVLALALLGLAERGVRSLVSRRVLATAGAAWIWAPGALERSESVAFYAVRDFELGAPPERARVHLLADEGYILYMNGRRVGSGAYFARAPLDTYLLDGLLRPGWNRVAVELRSVRGAGGLLLALFADGERAPLLRSGADWRIFHDATGVLDGTRSFDSGEPALVWQSPPTGGWGVPRLAPERPTFDDRVTAAPGRLEEGVVVPAAEPRVDTTGGPPLVSDFGRPVTGYLQLRGLAAVPRRLYVDFGLERSERKGVEVLLADGQDVWSATEARALRYVGSPYLPEGASLSVILVEPALAARDAERVELRSRGVFGVEPPAHALRTDR